MKNPELLQARILTLESILLVAGDYLKRNTITPINPKAAVSQKEVRDLLKLIRKALKED